MVCGFGGLILVVIYIIWEFRVKKNKRKQFGSYYSSSGKWALLFQKSSAYQETILVQDTEHADRYFVIDLWKDIDSFRSFKREYTEEYEAMDKKCEEFTEEERCLGFFASTETRKSQNNKRIP